MGRAILLGSWLLLCAACGGGATHTISIDIEGMGTVSFARLPGAPAASGECPSACDDELKANDLFMGWQLTATPAEGWAFERWETCGVRSGDDTAESVLTTNGVIACTAIFRACDATDPRDLADDPDGDPSLDLRCISVGIADDNRPWVRVEMEADWEPPAVYSWYTTVTLRDATTELGSRTEELHDTVRDTIVTGSVTAESSELVLNPGGRPGYEMRFSADLADLVLRADVETGILKTQGGIFRMDGAVLVDF